MQVRERVVEAFEFTWGISVANHPREHGIRVSLRSLEAWAVCIHCQVPHVRTVEKIVEALCQNWFVSCMVHSL